MSDKTRTLEDSYEEGIISKEEYEMQKEVLEEHESEDKTEDHKEEPVKSDKAFIITVIVIITLFVVLFGVRSLFPTTQKVASIDELNQLNIEGKLDPDQGYMYKEIYSFIYADGLWYTQVRSPQGSKELNLALHYGPRELEDVKIFGELNSTFTDSNEVYVTFNPIGHELQYVALAVGEFDRNLVVGFGKNPIAACDVNETEACKERPIVTCEDTDKAVVYFKSASETKVSYLGNCLVFEGSGLELTRAVDRVLMQWYGIMD